PRLLRRRPCLRPYLVERVAVVEPAVLHHVPYRVRVADVLERIAVQHEQVGELATLQCAEVAAETDRLGTEDRCGAQYIVLAHAAALHRPHLPVIAETLELAMAAHGRTTATLDQLIDPRGVPAERVLIFHEPATSTWSWVAATDLQVQLLRRREVLELRVVDVVLVRVEVVLGPRAAVRHDQCRRVRGSGRT